MAIQDIRKKIQKDSGAAKAFRRPATRGRMLLFSLLSTVAAAMAVFIFLEGSTLVAMGSLAIAAVLGAVAYDNWRRLEL
jgi:hypothetical protein